MNKEETKYMLRHTAILAISLMAISTPVGADEIGHGKTNDPDATPPETTTESCTSEMECAWQELLDVFEIAAD